jgi:glutamine amidotransferase
VRAYLAVAVLGMVLLCGGLTVAHEWGFGYLPALVLNPASNSYYQTAYEAGDLWGLLRDYDVKSKIVIAHVRRANRGRVGLENTHPFARELWGRLWTFAHNGQLKGVKKRSLGAFRPIGGTDSEHAFCWMLEQLRARFDSLPSQRTLAKVLEELCVELAGLGVFNILVSEGRCLYAFCTKPLYCIERRAPFGRATLIDDDLQVDFSQVTTPNDRVSVIATAPLTRDEEWFTLPVRRLSVFCDGALAPRISGRQ